MPVDPVAAGVSLHLAAREGEADRVRKRLAEGGYVDEVDMLGDTPFHKACRFGHLEAAQVLLQAGCRGDAKDAKGWTGLHLCAANGHEDLASLLVRSGCVNINAQNELGDVPLHLAAYHQRSGIVEALLQHGAKRQIRNEEGKTPKDVAQGAHVLLLFEEAETRDGSSGESVVS